MADTATKKAPAAPAAANATDSHGGRRSEVGIVTSDVRQKTIKVEIKHLVKHARYGKYIFRSTNLHAHDEKNEAKEGDTVEIAECRPLSKTKHHRLLRIVQRAPEKAVQVSAEEVMTGKAPEKR